MWKLAAMLGLNRPETLLVIHLGSRALTDPSDQIGVPAAQSRLLPMVH